MIDDDIEAIYRNHYRDVFTYALLLTRRWVDAEDIVGEAFERAVRTWRVPQYRVERPLHWLLATARHLATDRWRRAGRHLRAGARAPSRTDESIEQREALMWFQALSRVLTTRQMEVVHLRFADDLSYAEIAAIVGLTESGARSLVGRAIASLRSHRELWE